jgi:1,4-alpha-glucan branching enzyme
VAEPAGYLLLVLHAHMPFVRQSELDSAAEEDWLYDNAVHAYVPLARLLHGLVRDRAPVRVALSLTPPLLEMLGDSLVQERLVRYLDDRAALAGREVERLAADPAAAGLAREWRDRLRETRRWLEAEAGGDLRRPFRELAAGGSVEILASAATHAYLPLWQLCPELVELQVELGVRCAEAVFGARPRGFWLPECGYAPGLDGALRRAGIRFTFLGQVGLLHARPRPPAGVHAPVLTPESLAAFARDPLCDRQVQLREGGYPGDPAYLDPWRDLAHERTAEELASWRRLGERAPTGIRFRRSDGSLYDPRAAAERCEAHACHFAGLLAGYVQHLSAAHGRPAVVAATFDAEHFGHWWHEGPVWLNLTLRKLAFDQDAIRITSPGAYLEGYPRQVVATPSASSWGYQGHSETWLMGRNHWIYPAVLDAAAALRCVVERCAGRGPDTDAALGQGLRELLLAQSSDWAYILHDRTAEEYARRRVHEHLESCRILVSQVAEDRLNREWLEALRRKDNLFAAFDLLGLYREILAR